MIVFMILLKAVAKTGVEMDQSRWAEVCQVLS